MPHNVQCLRIKIFDQNNKVPHLAFIARKMRAPLNIGVAFYVDRINIDYEKELHKSILNLMDDD